MPTRTTPMARSRTMRLTVPPKSVRTPATTRAPAGVRVPQPPAPLKGPKVIDGVPKPQPAKFPAPAPRRTTGRLKWLKDKWVEVTADPEATPEEKAKVEKAVQTEEVKVEQSNEAFLASVGQMELRRQQMLEEAKAYKQAMKVANARKLAGG